MRKRIKHNFILPAWCECVLLDPHFLNGMLDFPAGLQTSRPRTDVWRTLGAEKVVSGNPPAIFVQVIIGRATAKAGDGMGASAPMFLFLPVLRNTRFRILMYPDVLCRHTAVHQWLISHHLSIFNKFAT